MKFSLSESVNPKYMMYLGLLVGIEQAVGHGTVSLTNLIPESWAPYVTSWCNFLAFVGTSIMTYQAALSGPQLGPLVNAVIPPSVKAAIVFVVLAGSSFAFSGDAHAAQKLVAPAVTGDLKKDLTTDGQNLGLIPPSLQVTPTGNVAKDLQTIWDKIVNASTTDLTYASKLAASANTPASGVRKQCWDAIITINNQASGLNLKNADGTPMTKPDPHAFTDVETLAEVIDNLSPSGPLFTACAGAAQLAKTNVLTFVNAVVTGAAGMAAMPIIPGL